MRVSLLCLALILVIFAGCTSTGDASTPTSTPRGPIVPTRDIPTHTPTATPTDTLTPTLTFTPTPTSTPSDTPTSTPTLTDTPEPSTTFTPVPPTETPTPLPTDTPQPSPTASETPTELPQPTELPTAEPTRGTPQIYGNATSLEQVELNPLFPLGETVYGSLNNDYPAALYPITGRAGMVLDIAMNTENGDLDPFLLVLDPKGREIVRNDDISDENRNAAIDGLVLPENGIYVIVAGRFAQLYGETTGDFGLTVTEGTAGETKTGIYASVTGYESLVTGTLNSDNTEDLYTFRAAAGDVINIQMSRTSGDLDPRLVLTDNLGNQLEANDDNLLTGTLDSAIQSYILRRAGYYTIVASRYSGSENAGDYRLKLAREAQNQPGVYALLDPVNSRTIDEGATSYVNYSAGDTLDDNGTEHTLQTLLTFRLPTRPNNDAHLTNATLQLAPCYQRGGGFNELGEMTIYQENYGKLSQARNIARPQPGAHVISTQSTCNSLDVTDLVIGIYSEGTNFAQFRMMFRDHTNNGTDDEVLFTPRLLLTFATN